MMAAGRFCRTSSVAERDLLLRHDLVVARLRLVGVDDRLGADLELALRLLQLFERRLLVASSAISWSRAASTLKYAVRDAQIEVLASTARQRQMPCITAIFACSSASQFCGR